MTKRPDGQISDLDLDDLREVLLDASVRRAVLFGSHARGTARESSDVDVAVEFESGLTSLERTRARLQLIEQLSLTLGVDQIDVVPVASAPPALRREIDTNGIVLVGDDDTEEREADADDGPSLDQFDDALAALDGVV